MTAGKSTSGHLSKTIRVKFLKEVTLELKRHHF